MIVTEGQIKMLRRGARLTLELDFRPIVGETYGAQLAKGRKRELDVSVIAAEKIEASRYRALVILSARIETPLLLKARPGTDDYTERSGLAMTDEPEPIDSSARDAYAKRARAAADAKRKAAQGAPGDLQIHLDAARRAEQALFEELEERFVDWTPHQIAEHAPHQGDAAAVRERRRRHHRRAIDGRIPLSPEARVEAERWLRQNQHSIQDVERVLDISRRAAYALWQEWQPEAQAA